MTGTESPAAAEQLTATEQPTVPECWTLLRSTPVGPLAKVVDGRPDIHPVNHLVDHGTVLFRTAEGTKLRAAVGHGRRLGPRPDAELDEDRAHVVLDRLRGEQLRLPAAPGHTGLNRPGSATASR